MFPALHQILELQNKIIKTNQDKGEKTHCIRGCLHEILAKLSFRYKFTPVPSCGSVFAYMIPAQNLIPEQVILVRVQCSNCAGARFSLQYENSFQCHVNVEQLFGPARNHSPGNLEQAAHG